MPNILGTILLEHLMAVNFLGDQAHLCVRVPTLPGKSLIFFLENYRTWKVLENHFGPGKSWKNILESHAFF